MGGADTPRASRPAASRSAARAAGGLFASSGLIWASDYGCWRSFCGDPLKAIFQSVGSVLQRGQSFGVGMPVVAVVRFEQAVRHAAGCGRVQVSQTGAHLGVQNKGLAQALIHPRLDLAGGGGPPHRIGDLSLDLAHTFGPVLEHALTISG